MIVGFHSLYMSDKLLAVLYEVWGSHSSATAASVFWGDTMSLSEWFLAFWWIIVPARC